MKVVFINTFDRGGGAALACKRLKEALIENFPEMNVEWLYVSENKKLNFWYNFLINALDKLLLYFSLKNSKDIFKFSTGYFGQKISKKKEIIEADVIHLHWTNNSFISNKEIKSLIDLKKPIIWTLHDMWFFTGGCHYTRGCQQFITDCNSCPYLRKSGIEAKIFNQKMEYFSKSHICLVGCSKWITNEASKSKIGNNLKKKTIPNPIDSNIFYDEKLNEEKIKNISLLFISANLNDPRKGLAYLLNILKKTTLNIELTLVGKSKYSLPPIPNVVINEMGFVNDMDQIRKIYNNADLFVCPSIEDNLPNTIMEALACGTPVLAFDIGGISDMVIHEKNGYLATFNNLGEENLLKGLHWFLENKDTLSINRNHISIETHSKYSYSKIAKEYHQLYQELLNGQ